MFGTFGYRAIAGSGINTLIVSLISKGFYEYLDKPGVKIAVGGDTRKSTEALKMAAISTLIENGAMVYDLGNVPTPVLQYFVRNHADGGIMITASHNPPEYNGIKLVDENGIGIPKEKAHLIEEYANKFIIAISGTRSLSQAIENSVAFSSGNKYNGSVTRVNPIPEYIEKIVHENGRTPGMKVVFDGAASVGSFTVPQILKKMGVRVLTTNTTIDPDFTWRHPEPTKSNISYLSRIIPDLNVDAGIAVDGDADRTILIDEKGRVISGDKSFALIVDFILDQYRSGFHTEREMKVVTTVATSDIIYDIAKKHGAEVITTKVGDPYVSNKLLEENALIGGEENGGVIFPWWVLGRDSGMTVAVLMKVLWRAHNEGKTLSKIVDALPHYYQKKTKLQGRVDYNKVKEIADRINLEYTDIDGVKIRTKRGWILIRNSGTEPIVRVFAESDSEETAEKLLEAGIEIVKDAQS